MSISDQEMDGNGVIKDGAARRRGGCYVSNTKAYILFFFYVASLVLVGIAVHFLAGRPVSDVETPPVTEAATTVAPTSAPVRKNFTNVRLPRSVLPRHYNLRLLPVLEKGNFSIIGSVDIDVEVTQDTGKIVLHSADTVVDESSLKIVRKGSNEQLTVHGMSKDAEREFLTIQVHGEKLKKGSHYTLSMSFVGQLNDQLKGFYRSTYVEDGVEKYLATTQMEPVDARRAFPCFDEPNMKAEFTVTLGRHQSMKALSNMPLVNSTPIDGLADYFWDRFERSVPMSTYLVAMIVADFAQVPAEYDAKWKFSVYARPSAENQTSYANEIGPKILAFYEEYFGIEYPLPKQDMIAIPDFSAGAMENWGLITYRETALLYDEKVSSVGNKQRVATVVAHELAHQWFGNLVTMDWWSDLWLNEGFASYVEYLGVNHVEPSLEMFQQIITSDVQDVMGVDALETSHPISVVVHHPDEINEIFDRISYGKGCSIIRMLSHLIGEKSFQEGLTHYLTSRKYGNAVQDDLWKAFTDLARKNGVPLPTDVKQIMDTWTLKMGYPVLNVDRNYDDDSATVTQQRFLLRKATSNDSTVYLWWVPVTYTSDFRTTKSAWLANNQTTLKLNDLGSHRNSWVIFNVDEVGYYRVNYDSRNWELITQQLMTDHTAISVINRAQIMDDALNLAQAGLLDYDIALNLTRYLAQEDEYLPWESTLSSLLYVQDMLSRSSAYGLLKKHVDKILLPLYEKVQFNDVRGDDYLTVYNRMNAVTWACKIGYKDCVQNAVRLYRQWMSDPDNVEIMSPNLKRIIVCTAIREGGEEEWNFAFQRYNLTNVASEKVALLSAMSCTRQGWILAKMLEGSMNASSGIRKQDGGSVFRFVAANPLGRYIAFNFLRNSWSEIKNYFGGLSNLGRIVDSVTMSFNTELELKELRQFHEEHKEELSSAARSIQQAIDRTQNNVLWMKVNYRKVVDWLERTYQSV